MKTVLGYKYQLGLEVLTPVAIGNGETMSLYTDFSVFEQNKTRYARILNKKLFEKELQANIPAMSDFVLQVREQAMKNEEGDKGSFLFNFIKESLGIAQPESLYYENQIPVIGNANTVNLTCCLKEKGVPYISGSTLKGAIKSALFYNWLQAVKQQYDLKEICKRLNDDLPVKKDIDKLIDTFFEKIQNKERMNYSLLRFTDAYFESDCTSYYHCNRYKTTKESDETIPSFLEAIKKGENSSFEIYVESNGVAKTTNITISELATSELVSLRNTLNSFAIANIEYELQLINNDELASYKKTLFNILTRIKSEKYRNAFFPIGFGKSNFYQSIGLSIWQCSQKYNFTEAFEKYLKLYKIGKKPKYGESHQKTLPLTRNTTIAIPHESLGWICITGIREEIKEQTSYKMDELNDKQTVEAKVLKIDKPHSTVEINGIEGKYRMTGTKDAIKTSGFCENCLVKVTIALNNEGKIHQTTFVELV